jgi:hypothetical protein
MQLEDIEEIKINYEETKKLILYSIECAYFKEHHLAEFIYNIITNNIATMDNDFIKLLIQKIKKVITYKDRPFSLKVTDEFMEDLPKWKELLEVLHKAVWRTYEEWQELGYYVVKGSKSERWNENLIALFNSSQVAEKPKYKPKPYEPPPKTPEEIEEELERAREKAKQIQWYKEHGYVHVYNDFWTDPNDGLSDIADALKYNEDSWD